MEFEGVVYKILPPTKGVSARGEWQRQEVIFEMPQEFSRKVCVTFFNKESEVARLKEGAAYTVSVNIESREYNGRWYTDVRAWRVHRRPRPHRHRHPKCRLWATNPHIRHPPRPMWTTCPSDRAASAG